MQQLDSLSFTVDGIVGKGRPRFYKDNVLTPPKTRKYEKLVQAMTLFAIAAYGARTGKTWSRLKRPVRVRIRALFAVPASASKKERLARIGTPCTKRPDVDNIEKAVLDGMNGIAYADDSCVFDSHTTKFWHDGEDKVEVTVEAL